MKERKLKYRFHNPNEAAVTADYILKIFIETNTRKVETAIQAETNSILASLENPDCFEGHSA